jgi:hypothetical protein
MTRVTTTPLAVSADYADALLAARRAKNWLFLLLLLGLLAQLTIFFLAKFDKVVRIGPGGEATATMTMPDVDVESKPATTAPASTDTSAPPREKTSVTVRGGVFPWIINSITYLGTIFSIALVLIVLLIVLIMLVGRLIGVSHTTSAFIWAVVLALLLFPWQLFYDRDTAPEAMRKAAAGEIRLDDYRWPGAFYTWSELKQGARFPAGFNNIAVLRYARFAGFPLITLIILFMVQAKSGRGVKYALGEAEVHVDVTTSDA